MRTNLDKWEYYLSIIETKTSEFINSQKGGKNIPSVYYVVYPIGKIAERTIIDVYYSHKNNRTYFNGAKPTKKDVEQITEYATKEIPFSIDNIYFKYSEIWDKENNSTSTSSVKFSDVVNEIGLYYYLLDAKIESDRILEENRIDKEFREQHKKDIGYNYHANGYDFLGWQNGWKHEYYDEDGELCSQTGKPRKSFGYSKENHPEYRNCIDLNHRRIEISRNSRGSENIVSCPVCKLYWKYDCSD